MNIKYSTNIREIEQAELQSQRPTLMLFALSRPILNFFARISRSRQHEGAPDRTVLSGAPDRTAFSDAPDRAGSRPGSGEPPAPPCLEGAGSQAGGPGLLLARSRKLEPKPGACAEAGSSCMFLRESAAALLLAF